MKLKHRIACAALLAAATAPAWALQLGQIQVKSALNQPLVAAIPLHPESLTELEGLTVNLASAADFAHAGLQITPADQSLRFHVTTDNNGQKLILVTSTQAITDPYLDFLIQVSTRQGKQVREFVVLLNPVIAAPAPSVQTAPVASAPAPTAQAPAKLPPASAFAQPAAQATRPAAKPESKVGSKVETKAEPKKTEPKKTEPKKTEPKKSAPKPEPAPAASAAKPAAPPPTAQQPQPVAASRSGQTLHVERGDTLYDIAKQETGGSRGSINQMMLALKTANPDAFFKDNINDLKSGAILRIPTRDEIDQTSIAAANAEVHRQYEAWRAARPQPATMVAGTAVAAAANAAPAPGKSGPESDHLALTPPAGEDSGAKNRPGVAGGTGKETVTGLRQQLQNDRSSLISLEQSNSDLESRVHSLQDISGKTDKLLSMKDATIAELQRKLAEVQSGNTGAASAASVAAAVAGAKPATSQAAVAPTASTKADDASSSKTRTLFMQWLNRPLTWLVAGLIVLALILTGLLRRRRGKGAPPIAKGPLPDPVDIVPPQPETPDVDEEAALRAEIATHPENLATYVTLCRLLHARDDEHAYIDVAKAMREHVTDFGCEEWHEVAELGEDLAPHLPLFELPAEPPRDPYGMAALQEPIEADETVVHEPEYAHPDDEQHVAEAEVAPATEAPDPEDLAATAMAADPDFTDDPVDTKLDLARAYLDMGDPVGARAMLEEVIEEGSQTQKDEAKRLLADVAS